MPFAKLLVAAWLQGDGEAPLVERAHPIASLAHHHRAAPPDLQLVPLDLGIAPREPAELLRSSFACMQLEDVVTLLKTAIAPDGWAEQRDWNVDLDGPSLRVRAPADVQEQVARFLARLTNDLVPQEQLEVRLHRDPARASPPARHASAALHDGLTTRGKVGEEIAIVLSDGAATRATTGIEFVACSWRVERGVLVDFAVRAAERASDEAAAPAPVPSFDFAACAGTVLLAPGENALVPIRLAYGGGEIAVTIELAVRIDGGVPSTRFDPLLCRDGRSRRLALWRQQPVSRPRVWTPRITYDLFDPGAGWFATALVGDATFGKPCWIADANPLEALLDLMPASERDSGCATVNITQDGGVMLFSTDDVVERFDRALAARSAIDAGWRLRGRIVDGTRERGTFELPLVVDSGGSWWAGRQGEQVDGVALDFDLDRDAGDALVLSTSAKLRFVVAPGVARTLYVDESRRLPANGGALVLGGDLRLELDLARTAR